jgi:putative salt-induced outer membrane protein YdiY
MISSSLLTLLVATFAPADSGALAKPFSPVAPLPEAAEQGWGGSVTVGGTLRTGNTETKSASLSADAVWRGEDNRLTLGAFWNYQEDSIRVIQRKVYGKGQFDHFYNEKIYSYANASGDHDYNSELDLRWTGGVGLGHQFREDETWSVSGELGASYVDEQFKKTPTNLDPSSEYIAARAAYKTVYLGGENWEFSHDGEIFPSLEIGDDIYARWDTRLKTNLTETMFAQVQWIYDYDNTPAQGKGRNDSLFALTIGWSF